MNDFARLRSKARLTQAEVSEILSVPIGRVASYEVGDSHPTPREIQVLRGMSRKSVAAIERCPDLTIHEKLQAENSSTAKNQADAPRLTMSAHPQSWRDVVDAIGIESATARETILNLSELFEEYQTDAAPWYFLWQEHCSNYFDLHTADRLLNKYVAPGDGKRLFLLQSYCKLLLVELLQKARLNFCYSPRAGLFDWMNLFPEECTRLRSNISRQCDLKHIRLPTTAQGISDLLGYLYQEIFPAEIRHLMGEYYTPDWLIDHALTCCMPCISRSRQINRILDPTAGSGGFLAHIIENSNRLNLTSDLLLIAIDVNPLAIEFCQINLALAKSLDPIVERHIECLTLLADPILDPAEEIPAGGLFRSQIQCTKTVLGKTFKQDEDWSSRISDLCREFKLPHQVALAFGASLERCLNDRFRAVKGQQADLIVGNPPWMTWDALIEGYRRELAAQWSASLLITQKGWRAKVAAGKTDISALFVYRASERHAARDAVMAFVLPMSLFQSRHAAAGFRRFRSSDGRRYKLTSLHDFSEVKVFGDAANRTALAVFEIDAEPQYPAKFIKWTSETFQRGLVGAEQLCKPIDKNDVTSPIVGFAKTDEALLGGVGKSDYRARGGVNTGGANTILWIDLLEKKGSLLKVQNVGTSRRTQSPIRSGWAEEAVVHPLLVGTDVSRWIAKPSKHILMFYDKSRPKKALDECIARTQYPCAYEFVSNFKKELLSRKEYHRWGGIAPFYEVYRIGPYTFNPVKVVWQHTGFRDRLRVAVLDDRASKITIPDQKIILIETRDIMEAHYICAFLSSNHVSSLLQRYLGTDASTHILDYIGLRAFSDRNSHHRRLAELSVSAHKAALSGLDLSQYENDIDSVVRTLRA